MCEEVTEQFAATSETFPDVQVNPVSNATATNTLNLGIYEPIEEMGSFTETFEDFNLTLLVSNGTITTSVGPTTTSVVAVIDDFTYEERFYVAQLDVVVVNGDATNTVFVEPQPGQVDDTAVFSETFAIQREGTIAIAQSAGVLGTAIPFITSEVEETGTVVATHETYAYALIAVSEDGTATETVAPTTTAAISLISNASAESVLSSVLDAVNSIIDTGVFIDTFKLPLQDLAWVLAPANLAVSFYRGFDFESITAAGDMLYTTSDGGVFQHNNNADIDAPIRAYWETNYNDYGLPFEKRIDTVYLSGKLQAMNVTARVYGSGHNDYTYPVEISEAGVPRTSRAVLGKGLVGTYWKLRVENADGEDFVVTAADLLIAQSNRRV